MILGKQQQGALQAGHWWESQTSQQEVLVVEQNIHRHFQRSGEFFECFDSRDRMPILNPADVAPEESCSIFNITLRQLFLFSQLPKPIPNNHGFLLLELYSKIYEKPSASDARPVLVECLESAAVTTVRLVGSVGFGGVLKHLSQLTTNGINA
jgi:hypothetical protein